MKVTSADAIQNGLKVGTTSGRQNGKAQRRHASAVTLCFEAVSAMSLADGSLGRL